MKKKRPHKEKKTDLKRKRPRLNDRSFSLFLSNQKCLPPAHVHFRRWKEVKRCTGVGEVAR